MLLARDYGAFPVQDQGLPGEAGRSKRFQSLKHPSMLLSRAPPLEGVIVAFPLGSPLMPSEDQRFNHDWDGVVCTAPGQSD